MHEEVLFYLAIVIFVFVAIIEILVVFLQAFIFTVLTAVFVGQAFEGEHPKDEHLPDDAVIV